MKEYIISLVSASLLAALFNVLTPDGEGGGISKHMRLLTALLLTVIILSPIIGGGTIEDFLGNITALPDIGNENEEEYRDQLTEALNSASRPYIAELLTQALEQEFSIPHGEVRCMILWKTENTASPEKISIVLSGSAIWKDPAKMESFVEERIGCECVTAIE